MGYSSLCFFSLGLKSQVGLVTDGGIDPAKMKCKTIQHGIISRFRLIQLFCISEPDTDPNMLVSLVLPDTKIQST